MPFVKWDAELKEDQRRNPVMEFWMLSKVLIGHLEVITDEMAEAKFPSGKASLQTWGRTPKTKVFDEHYIGIRKPIGLHEDRGFPRYTLQIMLRTDGLIMRGRDEVETPLVRGMVYQLDTHSPHEVYSPTPKNGGMFVALSMDSHEPMDSGQIFPRLIKWGNDHTFAEDKP